MPVDDARIDGWVRLAIFGDPEDKRANSGAVNFIRDAAAREVDALYPCCGAGGESLVSAADIAAYEEAVGYQIAAALVLSPAGRAWTGNTVQVKAGPITRTRKEADAAAAAAQMRKDAAAAMRRVSCVREAIIAARSAEGGGALFALAGRRRAIGEACTIQGQALGLGSCGVTGEDI